MLFGIDAAGKCDDYEVILFGSDAPLQYKFPGLSSLKHHHSRHLINIIIIITAILRLASRKTKELKEKKQFNDNKTSIKIAKNQKEKNQILFTFYKPQSTSFNYILQFE